MCGMYVLHDHWSVCERLNIFCLRVDGVLDYRLIMGGSMSPRFDDLHIELLVSREYFGHYWSRS